MRSSVGREEKVPRKVKAGWGEGSSLPWLSIKQGRKMHKKDESSMGVLWDPSQGVGTQEPKLSHLPIDPKVHRTRNWV